MTNCAFCPSRFILGRKKSAASFSRCFVAAKQVSFPVKDINETIDYSAIYQLIQNIMQEPEPLLETVAGKIVQAILINFHMPIP